MCSALTWLICADGRTASSPHSAACLYAGRPKNFCVPATVWLETIVLQLEWGFVCFGLFCFCSHWMQIFLYTIVHCTLHCQVLGQGLFSCSVPGGLAESLGHTDNLQMQRNGTELCHRNCSNVAVSVGILGVIFKFWAISLSLIFYYQTL